MKHIENMRAKRIFAKFAFLVLPILFVVLCGAMYANAQIQTNPTVDQASIIAIPPLISLTEVPNPLTLPAGPGLVTYTFKVANAGTVGVHNLKVADDRCASVSFVSGDPNLNLILDTNEIWLYRCTTQIGRTTTNTATATGNSVGLTATAISSATVVVSEPIIPPLIHLVAQPDQFVLPFGGGLVTYTYKVSNPGIAPIGRISVSDDQCQSVIGPTGDANSDKLLNAGESWIYTCSVKLTANAKSIATAEGIANGLAAMDKVSINVIVAVPGMVRAPDFPSTDLLPTPPNLFDITAGVATDPGSSNPTNWAIVISFAAISGLLALWAGLRKQKTLMVIIVVGSLICLLAYFLVNSYFSGQPLSVLPSPSLSNPVAIVPVPIAPVPTPVPIPTPTLPNTTTPKPIPVPKPIPSGLPAFLKIPSIRVNAAIEQVGLTAAGAMDTAAGRAHVGWFNLGPRPGQPGNAVIDGHSGIWSGGQTAIFDNLKNVTVGQTMSVVDDRGVSFVFEVRERRFYEAKADASDIFVSNGGNRLILITCIGDFNKITNSYPQRLVVFSDLIQ